MCLYSYSISILLLLKSTGPVSMDPVNCKSAIACDGLLHRRPIAWLASELALRFLARPPRYSLDCLGKALLNTTIDHTDPICLQLSSKQLLSISTVGLFIFAFRQLAIRNSVVLGFRTEPIAGKTKMALEETAKCKDLKESLYRLNL